MKTTTLLGTTTVLLALAATSGSAMADYRCDREARRLARQQEEMLEDQRDQQIRDLRHSTEHHEDALRRWYRQEKDILQAEYDCARRRLCGRAWSTFYHNWDDRRDALRDSYYGQRRDLTRGRVATERQLRDHYRALERSLDHGPLLVPASQTMRSTLLPTPSPILPNTVPPATVIPTPAPILPGAVVPPSNTPTLAPPRPQAAPPATIIPTPAPLMPGIQ